MKLLKYCLSSLILVMMIVIVLITIPVFLLLDGGMEALKTILEPTVFGKVLSAKVKA